MKHSEETSRNHPLPRTICLGLGAIILILVIVASTLFITSNNGPLKKRNEQKQIYELARTTLNALSEGDTAQAAPLLCKNGELSKEPNVLEKYRGISHYEIGNLSDIHNGRTQAVIDYQYPKIDENLGTTITPTATKNLEFRQINNTWCTWAIAPIPQTQWGKTITIKDGESATITNDNQSFSAQLTVTDTGTKAITDFAHINLILEQGGTFSFPLYLTANASVINSSLRLALVSTNKDSSEFQYEILSESSPIPENCQWNTKDLPQKPTQWDSPITNEQVHDHGLYYQVSGIAEAAPNTKLQWTAGNGVCKMFGISTPLFRDDPLKIDGVGTLTVSGIAPSTANNSGLATMRFFPESD